MKRRRGAHLPVVGLEPLDEQTAVSVMRGLCDARPTHGYSPCLRRYQIKCVNRRLQPKAWRHGIEPATG